MAAHRKKLATRHSRAIPPHLARHTKITFSPARRIIWPGYVWIVLVGSVFSLCAQFLTFSGMGVLVADIKLPLFFYGLGVLILSACALALIPLAGLARRNYSLPLFEIVVSLLLIGMAPYIAPVGSYVVLAFTAAEFAIATYLLARK